MKDKDLKEAIDDIFNYDIKVDNKEVIDDESTLTNENLFTNQQVEAKENLMPPENTMINNYSYNEDNTALASDEVNNLDESYKKTPFIPLKIFNINSNEVYLDYNKRLLINVVATALFALLFLMFLIPSIAFNKKSDVSYKQTSNLDYKVYLKPNNYYKEPYLDKNMQYIASIIDNVDVNFNYAFKFNQSINYKYTYYIKSEVLVTDTENKTKVIYRKMDKLTEPNTVIMDNSNEFNIKENVKINYDEYNEIIKAFKSSYVINADSNLILSLCVDIEDEKGSKIKDIDIDTMKLTIPLTEQMININMDYKEINNSDNVRVYKDFNISNKITFIFSIVFLIIAVTFLIRLIMFIRKTSSKKTVYDNMLSKILREYDRVIVNVKKNIDVKEEVIDVNSFEELLDVRDNLEKPIMFREIHKGQKSIFIVRGEKESYRYVLKLVDLQRKEENEKY